MRLSKTVISLGLFLLLGFEIQAQRTVPTDRWPYLYAEFTTGNIRLTSGDLLETQSLNICVTDGKLHYLENGKIMEAKMIQVFSAQIGEDIYLQAAGRMMLVLAETEGGAVLQDIGVDLEEMGKTAIGYGIKSSTASSTKLTGLVSSSGVVDRDLTDLIDKRGTGEEYPIKKDYYLLVGNRVMPADKQVFLSRVSDEKMAKNFLKQNKIKWTKTESLVKVIEYLKQYE